MTSAILIARVSYIPAFADSTPKTGGQMVPPPGKPRVALASEAYARRPFVLVDGLNVIHANHFEPRLEALLAVVTDLATAGYDFGCVFDANTRYKLREHQDEAHVEAYDALLKNFSQHFVEVTGKTRADDTILRLADSHRAKVVSNDQFKPYLAEYPWLDDAQRIIKLNCFRDDLLLGRQILKIARQLEKALDKLYRTLNDAPLC